MKKSVIKRLLLAAAIFVCAFLASCGMKDPYHTHAFGDWRVISEATCRKNGLRERVCECGEKETEVLNATGHSFGEWETAREVTCTEDGLRERTCHCGEKETQIIKATGHNFGDWTQVKKVSCTEDGEDERVCSCGEKETRAIKAEGHKKVTDRAIAASCAAAGKTEGSHCSVCGEVFTAQQVIPALEHKWQEATCASPKKCTVCGKTDGEALPHTMENGKCKVCGYFYNAVIYDGNTVRITYRRVKKVRSDGTRLELFFNVENKTSKTMIIQADAISLNGYCFNDISMSYNVISRTVGEISLYINEFDSSLVDVDNIEYVGGQFRILDDATMTVYDTAICTNVRVDKLGTGGIPTDFNEKNKLFEDSNCALYYRFIKKSSASSSQANLYLYLKNKTNGTLTIQAEALAINGIGFYQLIASDAVLPRTIGIVNINIGDFDFQKVDINTIEKLGGQLDIIQNAFKSYKVIFANSDKLE